MVFLPMMACHMSSIELAPGRRVGTGVVHRQTTLEPGGVFPDDVKVVYRQRPIPYNMMMELSIFSVSRRHMTSILEQILLIFDPTLQIQSTDAAWDFSKMTSVELTQIGNEEEYPLGTGENLSIWTLSFTLPIWLIVNGEVRSNIVDEIITRITTGETDEFNTFDDLIEKNKNDALANCIGCMPDGAATVRISND